jgi:hypothetical protein
MSEEASDTMGGGLRNWLGALGFIVPLIGVEIIKEGGSKWIGAILIVAGLPIYWSPAIWKWLRRGKSATTELAPLAYLSDEDSELGSAILYMVWRSAWAKWFAAQDLATSHSASEEYVIQIATHLVLNALTDGQLEVRGRRPGQLSYEPIPRTHWRSTALHMIKDDRTLWRMILIPRGGAEIRPDGVVIGRDQMAVQRTDQLATYDSLIVRARQFEKLWPRKDRKTDATRKRLLKAARKAGAAPAEIEKLSRD